MITPRHFTPRAVDARFRYALLFTNHRDTESTEGTIFLPDRETAIGQEIAALRARSSNRVVASCQWLNQGPRAFAAGEGSFPWPSSPGQGKNNILCVLCASVVNLHSGFHRPHPHGAKQVVILSFCIGEICV
jgi:hypothetical protein